MNWMVVVKCQKNIPVLRHSLIHTVMEIKTCVFFVFIYLYINIKKIIMSIQTCISFLSSLENNRRYLEKSYVFFLLLLLVDWMEVSGSKSVWLLTFFKSISFYVPQKKESQSGLEWHKGWLNGDSIFIFWVKNHLSSVSTLWGLRWFWGFEMFRHALIFVLISASYNKLYYNNMWTRWMYMCAFLDYIKSWKIHIESWIFYIKLRWALFVTYTIIQSITSSEMCSLRTHTWSSGQSTLRRPGEQLGVRCLAQGSHLSRRTIPTRAEIRSHNLGLQVQRSIH